MKLVRASGTLSLMALAAIASPLASADETAGWYGGISVGRSKAKIDDARITRELLNGGLATTSISDDKTDVGYKLFGGYQFNRYIAVEAGYFDLGKFGFTANTLPPGTLHGALKAKGVNLDLVGTVPITESFSVFGRVGANVAKVRDSFSGTGAVAIGNPEPSKRDTNYKVGLGLQYAFTQALAIRLEAERYRINDAVGNKGDIDLFSVGLIYRFGATPPPRAEPARVAAAPAKRPPPPPPPPPAPRKVSFSADSLFDFDKAVITPAGKQALDKFAADLKGVNFDQIAVTGHTDRIGAPAYNMKLSTRRAEAVKAYLVQSAGIANEKISAKGVDGSDPVTKPGDCPGKKVTKKLIACLQPDRRVDVEVTGTQ